MLLKYPSTCRSSSVIIAKWTAALYMQPLFMVMYLSAAVSSSATNPSAGCVAVGWILRSTGWWRFKAGGLSFRMLALAERRMVAGRVQIPLAALLDTRVILRREKGFAFKSPHDYGPRGLRAVG